MLKTNLGKFSLITTLFVLAVCIGIASSTRAQIFLVNQMALAQDVERLASIAYGPEAEQQLDIYLPGNTKPDAKLPVLIFFYGGCWGACETYPKEDYAFVAQTLTMHGIAVVIADYRLYPAVRFPTIIADAKQAVEWTHKNINRYGGDNTQLFLMGHSAGAHLAAMLAMNQSYLNSETYANVRGFIGLAGAYNFLPFDEPYMPELFGAPMSEQESQPIHYVDGSEPSTLLLYGSADTRVKPINIEGLFQHLKDVNSPVQKRIYTGVGHSGIISSFATPLRGSSAIVSDVIDFVTSAQSEVKAGIM